MVVCFEDVECWQPTVCVTALPILETLLQFLPYAAGMTKMIVTSRFTFPLTIGGEDMVAQRLELIGLPSFTGADEKKKTSELNEIENYLDAKVKEKLIQAGRGNPRLMEDINALLEVEKNLGCAVIAEEG